MRFLAMLTTSLIIAANSFSQTTNDPADMTECIQQIRAWGMSESAHSNLVAVAGIRIGGSRLEFKKDESSGIYWNSYTGSRCNLPNKDPVEAEREKMEYQYRLDREISGLKILADLDKSGFISSDEGSRFRRLVEFGYKAAYIAKEEKGNKELMCKGLQAELRSTDIKMLEKMLEDYEKLRFKAQENGLEDFPAVVLR